MPRVTPLCVKGLFSLSLVLTLLSVVILCYGIVCPVPATAIAADTKVRAVENYGRLPLSFEANAGQVDPRVQFLSRGRGYTLFLTSSEAVLSLLETSGRAHTGTAAKAAGGETESGGSAITHTLRMKLVGANSSAPASGLHELPGKSNYLIGNNPALWRTGVATYEKVQYSELYPGVNLVYYGNQRQLEYDFVLSSGANPNLIKLAFEGADSLHVDEQGDLVLEINGKQVRQHRPVIYQQEGEERREISGGYVAEGNQVSFRIDAYDTNKPLIIDPVLSYSTYLGGSGTDTGDAITVDGNGNAYVTGTTSSTDFPTTNPLQPNLNGTRSDVFVTKLNAAGTALVYSTYVGGSDGDVGSGIDVDATGNAYVTGATGGSFTTSDFPIINAYDNTYHGATDAFLFKLNPLGSALLYSTYLGGSGTETAQDVFVNRAQGEAYVVGYTSSANFPTTQGAFKSQLGAGDSSDGFVTKFNAQGTGLVYSTYFGGNNGADIVYDIVVDGTGYAYLTGYTTSSFFPVTAGAFQNTCTGCNLGRSDAYAAKLNPQGSALAYATYLGGSIDDFGNGIAVDSAGNAYVTGFAQSGSDANKPFPTTAGTFKPTNPGGNGFVTKVNQDGTALVYSTFLSAEGKSIAVDSGGNAYVTGQTKRSDYELVNPISSTFAVGVKNVVVAALNSNASALTFSSYLGQGQGNGIVLDGAGDAYLTGETLNDSLPTANPVQPTRGGAGSNFASASDAFVTKISFGNASPSVSISVNDSVVTEGDTGTVPLTFTVTLSAASTNTVSVDYSTLSGTAGAGTDFQSVMGTLTFAPGQTSQEVAVPVYGDSISEGNETFELVLNNPVNATFSKQRGVGTIVDNEGAVNITIDDVTITEGDAGTGNATFTVRLSTASSEQIGVNLISLDGTAKETEDYLGVSGGILFVPGITTQTITVPVKGDLLDEPDETFIVRLSNPTNGATILKADGVCTIVDNDPPPAIYIDDVSLDEGNAGTRSATFTLKLSAPSGKAVQADFATADGTAVAGTDYASASGVLTFNPGELTKTVTVLINGDTLQEPNETFFVNLTNPVNASISDNQGSCTILNDDAPGVQFSTNAFSFKEDAGAANIVVTRTGDLSQPMTVDYQTSDQSGTTPCQTNNDGIASDRCDYATVMGTLRFAAGEQSKAILIPLINDSYVEPDEAFTITLSNAQGATLGRSTASIIITDNDTQLATQNPIENLDFFIRQQYIDFLGREPDASGFQFWKDRTTGVANCAPGEVCDRIDTAQRFFQSDEFQERGFYVYRLYDAVLGRLPKYAEFVPEVARLNGPQTVQEQRLGKDAYLLDFMRKQEFRNVYGAYVSADGLTTVDATGFVNKLCEQAGVTPASKQALIDNLANGTKDPAHTLEDFIMTPEVDGVGTRFYDRARIVMQYFGFLRRDPDTGGFNFWWNRVATPGSAQYHDYRELVNNFLRSDEYNFRFAFLSAP